MTAGLKALRKEKKLTQGKLAEEIGSQKETISRYENGHRDISNEMLMNLAEFFDVPMTYLLGVSDKRVFEYLSDEEVVELEEIEDNKYLDAMIKKYKELTPDMQYYVRITVDNAYKSESDLGKLKSQQED